MCLTTSLMDSNIFNGPKPKIQRMQCSSKSLYKMWEFVRILLTAKIEISHVLM